MSKIVMRRHNGKEDFKIRPTDNPIQLSRENVFWLFFFFRFGGGFRKSKFIRRGEGEEEGVTMPGHNEYLPWYSKTLVYKF